MQSLRVALARSPDARKRNAHGSQRNLFGANLYVFRDHEFSACQDAEPAHRWKRALALQIVCGGGPLIVQRNPPPARHPGAPP